MATTYVKIASVTVGAGGAADITFSSIPATYDDLILFTSLRGNAGFVYDQVRIQFNASSTNYSFRGVYGDGSAAASETGTSQASMKVALGVGAGATASTFSNDMIYIPNYRGSTNKSVSSDAAGENNATTIYYGLYANLWADTSAITSIKIFPQIGTLWSQYSTATLYGIKKS